MEAELMVNITEHEVRVWAEREGVGRGRGGEGTECLWSKPKSK